MTRKLLLAVLPIVAVIGSYSSTGFTQTSSKQVAAIPFTFVFEGVTLPAGTYEVELMDSGMLLLLNSDQEPVEGEAATLPLPVKDAAQGPELIFVNSPKGYTLAEVSTTDERRLLTSQYGNEKPNAQQLRSVPITTVAEKSAASPRQAATQGR